MLNLNSTASVVKNRGRHKGEVELQRVQNEAGLGGLWDEPFCPEPQLMLYAYSLWFHTHGDKFAIKPGDSFHYWDVLKVRWRKVSGISCFTIEAYITLFPFAFLISKTINWFGLFLNFYKNRTTYYSLSCVNFFC